MRRNILGNPNITTDNRTFSYCNSAQNCCTGIDYHIVFNNWVPQNSFNGISIFIERKTFGSEGHSLVYFYVITDNACRTNYYACSVVDCEIFANLRTWVDI